MFTRTHRRVAGLLFFLWFVAIRVSAANVSGTVRDSLTQQPVTDVLISVEGTVSVAFTNVLGHFQLSGLQAGKAVLRVSHLGYMMRRFDIDVKEGQHLNLDITLTGGAIRLNEISITQTKDIGRSLSAINQVDRELRPVNSAQDLLRLVPGLFIAQHAGGGKAEQLFLRGFDIDHGTDFAIAIDGMPVNMVSHAHGQGYSDFHFVIPETVDKLAVSKGTYTARQGNFATSGSGDFTTKNALNTSLRVDYGLFDTRRALALINLGDINTLFPKHKANAYVAAEYFFTDSYFEAPQKLNRFNVFGKYTLQAGSRNFLSLSASAFQSSWDASGQVPDRAVREGLITRFGSIDPTEGGSTSRYNANAQLATVINQNTMLRTQVYYSYYLFDLTSNFTFFLNDSINGDGIRQIEHGRNLLGANTSLEHEGKLAGKKLETTLGAGTRYDNGQISLYRAIKRVITDTIADGLINEQQVYAWLDETLQLNDKWSINAALRYDVFFFGYDNYLADTAEGKRTRARVSPKLNLFYAPTQNVQLYVKSGFGFHSNDSRSVVSGEAGESLPRALGYETGSTFKLTPHLLMNISLWGLELQNELVFVGDEGVVEISGATRRLGADAALRWELTPQFFADADLNYSYGRFLDLPSGENFIPLAPRVTSTGGLSWRGKNGFNAALRYRAIDTRPANETNTVQAKGYFLVDVVANYTYSHFTVGFTIENLFNSEWNEAQFDTESSLRNESQPVSELHYTPGTPFFVKGSVGWKF
jgi:outer membrane receptor protein involved in Fe transport